MTADRALSGQLLRDNKFSCRLDRPGLKAAVMHNKDSVWRRRKGFTPHCGITQILLLFLSILGGGPPGWAATFSLSPTAISNGYTGAITLRIGGLTNGETILVEEF